MKNCCSNRPRRFGAGTWLSILAASAVFIVANRQPDRAATPIDVESLRRDAANRPAPPPLLKPEPKLLLENDALGLTLAQRERISEAQSAWDEAKSSLEGQMRVAVGEELRPNEQAIRDQLRNVPELSREYDRERRAAWMRALESLTNEQRSKLDPALRGGL